VRARLGPGGPVQGFGWLGLTRSLGYADPVAMSPGSTLPPRAFISYSHDSKAHEQRVLALADRLRADGLDVRLDQYVESPPEGWPRWTERQVVECSFVLLVCTPTYRQRFDREDAGAAGKGAQWEAMIAQQILYEAGTRNEKLIPVLFEEGTEQDVPLSLRAYTRYRLPVEHEALYRRLTGQPLTPAPAIGAIRAMPPAARPVFPVSTRAQGSASGGVVTAPMEITDDSLVDELAKVLSDADQARLVAQRAGFSAGHIPAFRMPIVFWTTMVEAARNGAIAGGVKAVAEAAAKLYPANPIYSGYRSR
jgi:hypothetical protein